MNRSLIALFAAGALCAGVIGCGGDNDKTTPTTSGGATSAGGNKGSKLSNKLTVDEVDVALRPKNVEVPTGNVQFHINNKGTLLHSLVIQGPSGKKSSKPILPHTSDTLSVNFDKPGKYKWYCPIDSHRKLGMKGTVTVR